MGPKWLQMYLGGISCSFYWTTDTFYDVCPINYFDLSLCRCVDNLDGKNVDHNDLPPVIQANASNLDIYEGRIKLDPIEEIEQQPKLPSPHLSAPVLPRIRPRPVLALKVEDQPTTNTLAAITHNLNNMKTMVTTAASFPDDDDEINPIQLQFKTNDI